MTLFGQSGGGTAVLAVVISPLSKGLLSQAWIMSGSPIMSTSLAQASKDNLSFLKNTGCTDAVCLLSRSPENITTSVNWNTFPSWNQNSQYDLPHKGDHDGSLPVLDGNFHQKLIPDVLFDNTCWTCQKVKSLSKLLSVSFVRV